MIPVIRIAGAGIAVFFITAASVLLLAEEDNSHFARVSSQVAPSQNEEKPDFTKTPPVDAASESKQQKSKPRSWYARLTLSGGYNSNVIGRGTQVALPDYISNEMDWFAGLNLDGGYRLYRNRKFNLWLDGRYRSNYLLDLHDFDLQYVELSPRMNLRLSEKWIGTLRGIFSHTFLGYDRYGYAAGVNPALTYIENAWGNVRLDYVFQRNEFFYTVEDSARDQDGLTHTLRLTQNVNVPDTKLTLSGGGQYDLTASDGTDYDYHDGQVFLNFWHPFVEKTNLRGGLNYGFWNYERPTTRANRNEERMDHRLKSFTEISRPFTPALTGFFRYQLGVNASNINDFHYRQHLFSVGVTQEF